MNPTAVLVYGFLWFLLLTLDHSAISIRKCLNYSWLGSNSGQFFINESWVSNRSSSSELISLPGCKEFPKPKPIPCVSPFIILKDEKELNTTALIEDYGDMVLCEPGTGDVCAVVAFFYAGKVFNLTAYCTRVTVDGTIPMKNGCDTATTHVQGFTNTVCACSPSHDGTTCNDFIPSGASGSPITKLPPNLHLIHLIGALICSIVNIKIS